MAKRKKNPEPQVRLLPVELVVFFSGLFLTGLGVFLLLSLWTADIRLSPVDAARRCITGLLGAWSAYGLKCTIGTIAGYVAAGLISLWGLQVMRGGRFWSTWPGVMGGMLMAVAVSLMSCGLTGQTDVPVSGIVSRIIVPEATLYLGRFGLLLASGGVFFLGSILTFGVVVFELVKSFHARGEKVVRGAADGCARVAGMVADRAGPKLAEMLAAANERAVVVSPVSTRRPGGGASSTRAKPAPAPEPESEEDEENVVSGFVVDAEVVEEPEAEEDPVAAAEEPEFMPYGEDGADAFAQTLRPDTPVSRPAPTPAPAAAKAPRAKSAVKDRIMGEAVEYELPPLELLMPPTPSTVKVSTGAIEKRAKILEETLGEFKIEGRVVNIECGPRVTMFEVMLAAGIRLNRVINLADNIAMKLKAPSVRIIAPIPGKDTIGIEIPNIDKELVCLQEIVSAVNRESRKESLPLCLAKDVSGIPVVADLAKMPHLLIAGATGSGKSVCINSIILSFLMCCKPKELKLIMVDPKVVELSRFRDIPHLMSPVITDMKRAVGVLEWACQKMDERYEQLSMVSVNNIAKFNALGRAEIERRMSECPTEELELFPKSLPYIVIIIDELADLMMVAGKEVEHHITRLAAKSRAVGIHLILATQRPSVDVITGLIKANMPSRIAFQVASKVDSRTILDQNGAETLLGAGDMLYLPPGVSKMTRCQGVFVADEELFAIVDYCKNQMAPEFHEDLQGPVIGANGKADLSDFDELFFDSGYHIIESGRGSVSLLQRKLGIGYGRASRIVDQLAAAGILGVFREGKARDIMMTLEEFTEKFGPAAGGKRPVEPMAGVRDDEEGPDDTPWDDEDEDLS